VSGFGPWASRIAAIVPVTLICVFVGLLWFIGLACDKQRRAYITGISKHAMETVRVLQGAVPDGRARADVRQIRRRSPMASLARCVVRLLQRSNRTPSSQAADLLPRLWPAPVTAFPRRSRGAYALQFGQVYLDAGPCTASQRTGHVRARGFRAVVRLEREGVAADAVGAGRERRRPGCPSCVGDVARAGQRGGCQAG
jgi:hypothetical protein